MAELSNRRRQGERMGVLCGLGMGRTRVRRQQRRSWAVHGLKDRRRQLRFDGAHGDGNLGWVPFFTLLSISFCGAEWMDGGMQELTVELGMVRKHDKSMAGLL
ncbi:hypothetical protein M0R45_026078 [Rubus argutus]|uniref:Uncharacterized protein n=1 Tax=Rubus argutus TaxID=59490 RepID=A0AAW1X029_RUBAR